MRMVRFGIVVALLVGVMACPSQVSAESFLSFLGDGHYYRGGSSRPLWDVNVGSVILDRSTPQPSKLIQNWDQSQTLFNAGAFGFAWNSGPDISVTRRLDRCKRFNAFEVRYFGVDSWRANTTATVTGIWRFPSSPGVFAFDARVDSGYKSELHNVEINLFDDSRSHPRWTWLVGFRWLQLDEQLNMDVYNSGTSTHVGDYIYSTKNNLYGGQIGLEAKLFDRGQFWVDGLAKAGVYGNVAGNRYWGVDSGGTHPFSNDNQDQVAFVGDLAFTATWQISRHLALNAGYKLLWVQGVAIAGDQAVAVDLNTHNGITTRGGAFYHGATVSVDFRW